MQQTLDADASKQMQLQIESEKEKQKVQALVSSRYAPLISIEEKSDEVEMFMREKARLIKMKRELKEALNALNDRVKFMSVQKKGKPNQKAVEKTEEQESLDEWAYD